MHSLYYRRGKQRAIRDLLAKHAAEPEMGDALYTPMSSATGSSGRVNINTSSASTHFDEHDRHLVRDPHKSTTVVPVGSYQSKRADYKDLVDKSPVLVHKHPHATLTGGGGFLSKDYEDIKSPAILMDPDNEDEHALAHEIGHARLQNSTLGALAQHPISRGAALASPAAALAAGMLMPSKRSKMLGIAAAMGLTVPTLASEGMADYEAHKFLKEQGRTPEETDAYLKSRLGGQASYLGLPALTALWGGLGHGISKIAKHRLHGRRKFRDLDISIENRKGSVRKWYDPSEDRHGETVQQYPYGYIRMTEGMDGDHVDCYVGPNEDAKYVYVITTNKAPDFKKVDEQKCMLGFDSAKAARAAFAQHYDSPKFFHSMKAFKYEDFESKVLATRTKANKKLASDLIDNGPGPFHDSTPGDYLGFPSSSLVGMRSIKGGHPDTPSDRIDRMFRFHDNPVNTNSNTIDNMSAAQPAGPGV